MDNPLLDFSGLARFDEIRPEHITPAITQLLERCRSVVAEMEKPMAEVTWENFVTPLDDCTEQLSRAWGIAGHLSAVADTPELRAAYNENIPAITEFWTSVSQNLALFEKYKTIRASAVFDSMSPARKRLVENTLRDFRLGGAELPDDKKKIYAGIQEKTATLSTRFSENLLDAMNSFELLVTDEAELSGLPEDALAMAKAMAEAEQKEGWKFTLHFPSYLPVMQYADNRDLREKMYRAYGTRASELGEKAEWDNTQIIQDLLKLRKQEAGLLGYQNFAEVSLVPKMADTPENVIAFLEDLAKRARPSAEKDLAELKAFAAEELGIADVQSWDMTYVSEKLRQKRYAFSDQEVKQYFPEANVVNGLFSLVSTLYGITIKPDEAPVWHKDVKFFRIEKDGKLIGQFYTDLYARNGKRGGAWMDDARSRRMTSKGLQTPIAYLNCNFSAPVEKDGVLQPALFTHDEVQTLFHEFGHCLHHLLTEIGDLGVSGISGVEWDAVELPSQFMENFCWEWDVVSRMSSHVKTGEKLPRELFDKMIAAKNYQSGMGMLRQVEFALVDMHLHFDYDPEGAKTARDLLDEIRKQFAVTIPPAFNRFLNSFSHIFAGGYSAGYFSYKWAEVLSADVYSAFEEAAEKTGTTVSPEMGAKLVAEILSRGGSRPAIESFEAFRGRKPTIDALLRHSGLLS